jgi:hypothetical protein
MSYTPNLFLVNSPVSQAHFFFLTAVLRMQDVVALADALQNAEFAKAFGCVIAPQHRLNLILITPFFFPPTER